MPRCRTLLCAATLALATLSAAEPIPLPVAEADAAAEPQTYSGTFSGAFQVTSSGSGTPAVPAVCPAEHPTSCSSIGAAGWCCGSGYTCGWNGGSVGCCPSGQTCAFPLLFPSATSQGCVTSRGKRG